MLFHMSITADDPQRVAGFFAQIWGGEAVPFPPVMGGYSWFARAGDERNTTIEVYPRGTELHETPGDFDGHGEFGAPVRHSGVHGAIATSLSTDEVLALAAREGWPAKYRNRGGLFGVIEVWVEGCQMMEILTPEMQAQYRATVVPDAWRNFPTRRREEA